jgi:hypothetical protein
VLLKSRGCICLWGNVWYTCAGKCVCTAEGHEVAGEPRGQFSTVCRNSSQVGTTPWHGCVARL